MNWRVLGTWAAPKKVRGEDVDDEVAKTIRAALAVLAGTQTTLRKRLVARGKVHG
jgi:hypothetical protein